jgi:hypothetical protein
MFESNQGCALYRRNDETDRLSIAKDYELEITAKTHLHPPVEGFTHVFFIG